MQKQREKNKKMYFEQITKKRLIYRFKNSIVKSKINVVKLNLPIIKSPDLIWRSVLLYGYDIALFDIFVNFLKFLKIFNILFLKHNNFGNNIKFKNFFLNSDLQKYLKVKFKKWKKKKKRKIKFKIIKRKKYRFKKFKKKTRKDFDNRFYKWWKHKFNFKFLLVLKKKLAIEFKNPPWVKIGRHWKPPVFSKVQTWSRNFISSNGWYHHYYKGWSASDYVYWSKYKNYENLFLRSKLFWLRKLNFFHWFFYYKLSNRNKKHQQHIFKKFNVSEFLLYKKQYPRIKRNKKLYNKWKNLLLLKKFSEFRKKIIYRKFKKFKIGQWKMWLRFSRKSFNTIPLIFRKFARINSFKFYRRRLRKFLFNWKLILFQVVNKINYLHVRKFDKFLKYKKLFYKIAFFTFQRFLFKKRKPHRVLSKLKKLDYNWVLSRLRKKKKIKHNKKIIKYYERFIEKKKFIYKSLNLVKINLLKKHLLKTYFSKKCEYNLKKKNVIFSIIKKKNDRNSKKTKAECAAYKFNQKIPIFSGTLIPVKDIKNALGGRFRVTTRRAINLYARRNWRKKRAYFTNSDRGLYRYFFRIHGRSGQRPRLLFLRMVLMRFNKYAHIMNLLFSVLVEKLKTFRNFNKYMHMRRFFMFSKKINKISWRFRFEKKLKRFLFKNWSKKFKKWILIKQKKKFIVLKKKLWLLLKKNKIKNSKFRWLIKKYKNKFLLRSLKLYKKNKKFIILTIKYFRKYAMLKYGLKKYKRARLYRFFFKKKYPHLLNVNYFKCKKFIFKKNKIKYLFKKYYKRFRKLTYLKWRSIKYRFVNFIFFHRTKYRNLYLKNKKINLKFCYLKFFTNNNWKNFVKLNVFFLNFKFIHGLFSIRNVKKYTLYFFKFLLKNGLFNFPWKHSPLKNISDNFSMRFINLNLIKNIKIKRIKKRIILKFLKYQKKIIFSNFLNFKFWSIVGDGKCNIFKNVIRFNIYYKYLIFLFERLVFVDKKNTYGDLIELRLNKRWLFDNDEYRFINFHLRYEKIFSIFNNYRRLPILKKVKLARKIDYRWILFELNYEYITGFDVDPLDTDDVNTTQGLSSEFMRIGEHIKNFHYNLEELEKWE